MTLRKELQNDIANIRLGQLLVCALIRFPVQVAYYYLEVHEQIIVIIPTVFLELNLCEIFSFSKKQLFSYLLLPLIW